MAKLLTDTAGGTATYEDPIDLGKALRSVDIKPSTSTADLYADGQSIDTASSMASYELTLDTAALPLEYVAYLLGHSFANGRMTANKDDAAPYFAVMFQSDKRNGGTRYLKFFKCQFSEPSVTGSTKEENISYQTPTITAKDAVKGWGSALKTVAELLVFIGEQMHTVSERMQANKWLLDKHPMASPFIAVPFAGGAILDKMYGDEYKAYLKEQKALQEKAKAEKDAAAEAGKNKRAQFDDATLSASALRVAHPVWVNAAAAKKRADAEKQTAKATEESAKANKQLTDSLYDLTHNELEKSLHDINKEVEQFKEKGASVDLLDEYKLARQAKAYEDFQRFP